MKTYPDRQAGDEQARQVVLQAYRDACGSMRGAESAFDAALDDYMTNYPHISRTLARHAVAYILSTEGL